jgi:hypothetical protein
MDKGSWTSGVPGHDRCVLVLGQEEGASGLDQYGFAIASWNEHANEWRFTSIPRFTEHRDAASVLRVAYWRELPEPPKAVRLYQQ